MKPLSPAMILAIEAARHGDGKLSRWKEGFWVRHGTWLGKNKHTQPGSAPHKHYFYQCTIQALVDRGLAEYTSWDRYSGQTEVTLTERANEKD